MRRGEEQLEANNRSAATRTRFGGMSRRAFSEMAKSEITGHAVVVDKAMMGYILWLEVERLEGMAK